MFRTMSVFRALQTPVTSAPSAAAIWTANVPDPSRGAVDQNPLPGLDFAAVADRVQGGHGCHRHCRRLFERQAGRFGDDEGGVGDGIFGEGASGEAEDLVAGPQVVHVGTDVQDAACDVDPGDPSLRFGQADATHEAGNAWITAHHVPVVGVDRGGVNLEKHLSGADLGPVDRQQLQGVRWAESVLNDRFHQVAPGIVSLVGGNSILSRNAHFDSFGVGTGWVVGVRLSTLSAGPAPQASTRRSRQAANPMRIAA